VTNTTDNALNTVANATIKNNATNAVNGVNAALNNAPNNAPKGIDLSISLSHFVCAHHGCLRCFSPVECSFKGVIRKHPLIALLKMVDHLDASNPANSGKQPVDHTVRDNFFYPETEIDISKFNVARTSFYSVWERHNASRSCKERFRVF
jgi:hypothetical protein